MNEFLRSVLPVILDLSLEDSGNYTCEVRGPKANILGSVTHYLFIRGKRQINCMSLLEIDTASQTNATRNHESTGPDRRT